MKRDPSTADTPPNSLPHPAIKNNVWSPPALSYFPENEY